jgi:hypothetical protein
MIESIDFYPSEKPSIWDIWLDEYIKKSTGGLEKKREIARQYKRRPW